MNAKQVILSGMLLKKMLDRKIEPTIEKYGLRMVELEILVFLAGDQGDTAKDIVAATRISKAHISKSIDNLKQKGFVTGYADRKDRRIQHLYLQEGAREAVADVLSVYEECREVMLRGMTMEERMIMNKVMKTMTENISRELE